MGTRHLITVVVDGETKVAQYGQWDGYPTGQGITIAEFLRSTDLDHFADNVRRCTFIDDAAVKARWQEVVQPNSPISKEMRDSGTVSWDESEEFARRYPELHRNTGAAILAYIDERPRELFDSSEFADDSMFCEWTYEINLDNDTVTVGAGGGGRVYSFDEFTIEAMRELENA